MAKHFNILYWFMQTGVLILIKMRIPVQINLYTIKNDNIVNLKITQKLSNIWTEMYINWFVHPQKLLFVFIWERGLMSFIN